MRQSGSLRYLLWLIGLLVVLAGCTTPSTQNIQAAPTSSGIVAHLAYSSPANGTYRLPPINGVYTKEGLYTKTMWTIVNPQARIELVLNGVNVAHPGQT